MEEDRGKKVGVIEDHEEDRWPHRQGGQWPYWPAGMESPIGAGETVQEDGDEEVVSMKPQQVRLAPYPQGFKSILAKGATFNLNGEVFEVYGVKDPKNGHPRFLVRGLGIVAIVDP